MQLTILLESLLERVPAVPRAFNTTDDTCQYWWERKYNKPINNNNNGVLNLYPFVIIETSGNWQIEYKE